MSLSRHIGQMKRTIIALSIASFFIIGTVSLHAQDAPDSETAAPDQSRQQEREQAIVSLTNQARQDAGLKPLAWDAGLAAAARAHAARMAAEGPIAHRYNGEPDVPQRASTAGAHFSLIEENVAVGPTPFKIHEGWMNSQAHHDNLLNPKIDRIGVGLVQSHGVLYAVADYAQGVAVMSLPEVESSVAKVLGSKGLTLVSEAAGARFYCAADDNSSGGTGGGMKPKFLMRWQSADILQLPPQLQQAIQSGNFKQASVGACNPKGDGSSTPVFSGYRVAVLLY